jgi:3-oxoacyl-(acyl-carrier-protein) synthase
MALAQAGCSVSEIDFINVHGTATPHNDLTEGRWILKNAPQAKVVATKGYTGHTLGAAGAIEAVFTVLSLSEQKLPVSRGFQNVDPEIGVSPTTAITAGQFNTALSLSLGFGGANSALVLGTPE